ncbi:hypothetical protein KFK09_023567 [Dendrobium nobile]|uniref:Uncharacterized protein n=1 Tax=Dendrobium nobile TaxID=94219 RepID=A0A8T3ABQ8_DENNO|nr:hypothetical protein KFK09_023567 [Dendrobium nobile]
MAGFLTARTAKTISNRTPNERLASFGHSSRTPKRPCYAGPGGAGWTGPTRTGPGLLATESQPAGGTERREQSRRGPGKNFGREILNARGCLNILFTCEPKYFLSVRHLLAGEQCNANIFCSLNRKNAPKEKDRYLRAEAKKMAFDRSSTTPFLRFAVFWREKWSSPLEMP